MPRYVKRRGDRLYVYEQYSVRIDGKVRTPTKYIGPLEAVVNALSAVGDSIFDFLHANYTDGEVAHRPVDEAQEAEERGLAAAERFVARLEAQREKEEPADQEDSADNTPTEPDAPTE